MAQIRAYNAGNENFDAAETIATVEIYSTHRDILNLFTPNNDGFNDLWEIPELASYGKCNVRIYNRWGKSVFSSPDYNNTWDGTSDGKIFRRRLLFCNKNHKCRNDNRYRKYCKINTPPTPEFSSPKLPSARKGKKVLKAEFLSPLQGIGGKKNQNEKNNFYLIHAADWHYSYSPADTPVGKLFSR
jgi:gliding motility-associated-like protein